MNLLLFGAEFEQRGPQHPDAEALERRAGIDSRHFLLEHLGLFGRQARAAIGLGPVGLGIALLHAAPEPLFLRVILDIDLEPTSADIVLFSAWSPPIGGQSEERG